MLEVQYQVSGKTALCRKFVNGDFCDHSSEPHWPIKKFSTAEFKINMRVVEPSALYPYMDKTLRMPWKCDAAIIVYDVTDAVGFLRQKCWSAFKPEKKPVYYWRFSAISM